MHKLAILVGSLRQGSYNRKLARALEKLGAEYFACQYPDLNLPLYNEDLWQDPPASVLQLKADIAAADAVLFVTPEYNRSMPPVIKNAVDWGSRPFGQNSWKGKPAGIAGASMGNIGTAVSQSHLRSSIVPLGVILMGQPELYFKFEPDAIDGNGEVAEEKTRAFLQRYMDSFGKWVEATKSI